MSETEHSCASCGKLLVDQTGCDCCSPPLDPSASVEGPSLVDKEVGQHYQLSQSVCKIGRDKSNNISLPNDSYISRHHAWVLFIKGNYFVEDLGSTNGTLLNGEVLAERKQIFPGDRIKFGRTELVFEIN
ncbi:MAG: FHA domain-containing protein [Candidatus Obscuribacterales bacterium]|nr:FHA domain-containing protein [Candidatus Obscuribacterales bacterium]